MDVVYCTKRKHQGLLAKCICEFPQYFQQAPHSNMTKASKWWNRSEMFICRLEEEGVNVYLHTFGK